ncbi:predicted protein [Arabidopsis lyrata subsp. lyrata]|uniref:Predicted protein n=1 Tax=Arabidopsis lyrata subsp. lyrata TaxID=81972 RepID=D7MRY7_ARALL|nr:predicted protein [Arabidopsis lyrata subsp. lyrata]
MSMYFYFKPMSFGSSKMYDVNHSNAQLVRKMKKWLGTQAFINIVKVLSIQELMNSTPRHYYDEHGVVGHFIDNEVGILNVYALAHHFRKSGTVYEEDCPITEEQVFLDESTTTEGCERIIPSICDVHSIYDYIADYGGEDGLSMFHQELEYQLREGGPLSIQFEVYHFLLHHSGKPL